MSIFDLSGHTALVTGSSRGIGKALVSGLAQQGADVIVHCAHNIDQAQAVAEKAVAFGVKAIAVQADLSSPAAPDLLEAAIGSQMSASVDILVLNASAQINKPWDEITQEDFEFQMAVNVRASLALLQRFLPPMAERGWGRVVTVGSVQQVKPHPRTLVYAATKDAQMSMVRNLAKQVAAQGVTVNNLAPGFIATDRNADAMADENYMTEVLAKIPAGKVGESEDCLGATLLLCSEAGRYITGINLIVDGGLHL
jgi:NAD(P)-dependent dehydrogenase (short-subunit alcohol dehydrogenase family)